MAVKTYPPLAAFVRIHHTCVPLTQPDALATVAAAVIRADLAARNRDEATPHGSGKQPRRTFPGYLRRWQALWATPRRRVLLGEATAEPDAADEMAADDAGDPAPAPTSHERLRAHWAAHFAARRIDRRIAAALARRFGANQIEAGAIPTAADIQACLARCRRSAPGPDGVPHTAWKATGRLGAQVLACSFPLLLCTQAPHQSSASIPRWPVAVGEAAASRRRAAAQLGPSRLRMRCLLLMHPVGRPISRMR